MARATCNSCVVALMINIAINIGEDDMWYNEELATKQNCSDEQKARLDELYEELHRLFASAMKEEDKSKMSAYSPIIERIEYDLQKNWNFPQNSSFHRYWCLVPGCTCPKMDNQDRFGTRFRVYDADCPVHTLNQFRNHMVHSNGLTKADL